jgi:hypothetical protein
VFQAPGVLNPFRVGSSLSRWSRTRCCGGVGRLRGVRRLPRRRWSRLLAPRPGGAGAVGAAAASCCSPPRADGLAAAGCTSPSSTWPRSWASSRAASGRVSGVWSTPASPGAARRQARPASSCRPDRLLQVGAPRWAIGRLGVLLAVPTRVGGVSSGSAGRARLRLRRVPACWPWRPPRARPSAGAHRAARSACSSRPTTRGGHRGQAAERLALDYPRRRLDIVVASDGSVDGTNEIVRRSRRACGCSSFPRRGQDRGDQRRHAQP